MATFVRLPSGNWRAPVRRKGRYISETFRHRRDAEEWALAKESRIDRGEKPSASGRIDPTTFGHLIDLHLADLKEIGKCPRRSKAFSLDALNKKFGRVRLADLTRERLITFGRDRARGGAGPAMIGADLSYIKTVIAHAAAVQGVAAPVEPVGLARLALKRLGLVEKAKSRDRRPTQNEFDRIFAHLEQNPRQSTLVARIARFAIATARRQDEISRLRWRDVNGATRTATIRDRKDPREKSGNHQKVPFLNIKGIDAWDFLQVQAKMSGMIGRFHTTGDQSAPRFGARAGNRQLKAFASSAKGKRSILGQASCPSVWTLVGL